MALRKLDVLQALAQVRLDDGSRPLEEGRIADVSLQNHPDGAHVVVFLVGGWEGAPVPAQVVEAIKREVGRLPQVTRVTVEPVSNKPPSLTGTVFLAVASGKGGVGKSSVSVNLAVALARRGIRTAILDCDIYGFGVPQLIGLEEPPRLDKHRKIIPGRARGVAVMSMDYFVKNNQAVIWRGPLLGKALRQFLRDGKWDGTEVMVLDLPPGTGDVALDIGQLFPEGNVIVVTTPDPYAARVAERAGSMARVRGQKLLGVVENMAYLECPSCSHRLYPFGRGGGEAVAQALGVPLLARIPLSPEPQEDRRGGVFAADSVQGRAYEELATTIESLLMPQRRAV